MKKGRKRFIGVVVSNKADKTIKVRVERTQMHPLYKKRIRTFRNFLAHDEKNECEIGDVVEIIESRPISKLKKWRLVRIIEKGGGKR